MQWLLKTFLSDPTTKAKALKWLRWASQGAGAATLTLVFNWLMSHHIDQANATAIATVVSTAVGGLILSGGSALYSMVDANNVGAKIAIAKAGGTDAQINDTAVVKEVKAAVTAPSGTPAALQQVQAVLEAGKE